MTIVAFASADPVTLVESVFKSEIVVSSIPVLTTIVSATFEEIPLRVACAVITVPTCCFGIVSE